MARVLYGIHALIAFVLIILLAFCPLLIALPWLPARRAVGRLAVRAWLASIGVPLTVRGLQHLPQGPCVVACNHASYVDGIVLTSALPSRFTFLVQHKAAGWPYVGLIIRRMGVRFVNRENPRAAAAATLGLLRMLRGGGPLAIFPEGTFRAEPGLMPFYSGAFFLAAKTGLPLLPVAMRGTRSFFGDGARWPQPGAIEIEILPPLLPADASWEAIRALQAETRRQIAAHGREAAQQPAAEETESGGLAQNLDQAIP